jgi:S1-C subfamily serine protease
MKNGLLPQFAWFCFFALATANHLIAQAPGVPVVPERGGQRDSLDQELKALREQGKLMAMETVKEQMQRTHCELTLPPVSTTEFTGRQLWQRARDAHVRLGWYFLCKNCDIWHQNLGGGYFIASDGTVATCHHVILPGKDIKEGYLIAIREDGTSLPVLEVLAADEAADAAIVRVKVDGPIQTLPLNTEVYPGDAAWCYSYPLGYSSYFSKGMVNRFFESRRGGKPTPRMDVSTDWAPGSSGSAVIDECGNAIGHVSEIATPGARKRSDANAKVTAGSPITFHYAARAADVKALIKPGK